MSEDNNKLEEFDTWLEEFLSGLLELTGLDIWVSSMDIDEIKKTYIVELDGKNKSKAIGKDGQMLNALQHIAVAAAANKGIYGVKISIDVDGYRNRRDNHLQQIAQNLAQEVLDAAKPIDLEPMNARDRRMVHMYVSKIDGVYSESQGQGKDRFIRLLPKEQ